MAFAETSFQYIYIADINIWVLLADSSQLHEAGGSSRLPKTGARFQQSESDVSCWQHEAGASCQQPETDVSCQQHETDVSCQQSEAGACCQQSKTDVSCQQPDAGASGRRLHWCHCIIFFNSQQQQRRRASWHLLHQQSEAGASCQ